MVFTDLPLIQEFKTLGMDDYLWVQALFNHEELERLRGVELTDPHQRFLWRIIRMGVINPEAGEKVMDASTRSMRHSSAIGMRLWKMWREAESRVSPLWSFLGLTHLLTSSIQADRLESQMRVQLEIQEGIDLRLEQRNEELHQLRSQSQADGAQFAALSLQLQELISSVESRAEVVGRDFKEINRRFDCHRGEINCLKIREKDSKEVEKLKGFVVGAGHEAQIFKDHLNRMEENVCKCGQTPSEVGEEFISSEDEGRTELSHASVREDEYIAPPVENSIPLPVPALPSCCLGPTTTLLLMEEIAEEPAFICEDLDSLLREADEERARELGEGSSNLVVRSPPRVGSEQWRRLNGIHCMRPGPGRSKQRATHSCPYLRRDTSRHRRDFRGPGEPGGSPGSSSHSGFGAVDTSLLWGDEGVSSSLSGRLGLVLQGEELVRPPGSELGLWICDPPEDRPL